MPTPRFRYEYRPPRPFLEKLRDSQFVIRKLRRAGKNWAWDLWYGGPCGGVVSPRASLGASETSGVDYEQLAFLFDPKRVPIRPADVLVDVGCGKARVINFWLLSGFRNPMVGIEIKQSVALRARNRLRRFPNVTVIAGDAVTNLPPGATVFYLYNPFSRSVMERFKKQLEEQFGDRGNVTVVYCLCYDVDLFDGDPRWSIEMIDDQGVLTFPSAIIRMVARRPAPKSE